MTRPYPDLWHAIAALLLALRTLLRATAPEAFAQVARDARAQLAAISALVRRYLYILAAEIVLPPPRRADPRPDTPVPAAPSGQRRAHFQLFELAHAATGKSAGTDPPELQWALLFEAAERLAAVLRDPAPHARRLARRFGTLIVPGLRDLPVPWHVTRRIDPITDTLLMRLDTLARPQAWAGVDSS